jgi:ankyrin repeat protein
MAEIGLAGTTDGKTALHFAANEGHLHLVHALVSAGANMEAVSSDQYARTPIHCAAYNGHFNVVQYLVSQGARVESLDADGISALTLGEHNPEICAAISTGQANNYQLRLEPPQTGF